MKIQKIVLQDFRCFEYFEMEFSSDYNTHVIIAENMVGKSAILAAIKLAANSYTSGLQKEKQFSSKDHRVIGNNPIADITPEVSITTTALLAFSEEGKSLVASWKKYKTKPSGEQTKNDWLNGIDLKKKSKEINRLTAEGKAIQPLFSYIGTEYIHVESSDTTNWDVNGKSLEGYQRCFDDKSIKKFLFKWLDKMDGLLGEMSRKPIMAESFKNVPKNAMLVFKQAVVSVLPDIQMIEWSHDAKQPIVKFQNGEIRLFDMLSDGYRYLILLAGELATRAFILNKYLGESVLHAIRGLVIIDEFGIHLHPSLQNDSLIRLQNTFPHVQFIISTHSPLLLNGLKKEQIHILHADKDGKRTITNPDEDIVGLGANEILLKVFGLASTMDNQFLEWDKEYTALYQKKVSTGLTSSETAKFKELSEQLAKVRLDPELSLVKEEDPVTVLVKQKLGQLLDEQATSIQSVSNDLLASEVETILDNLFKK